MTATSETKPRRLKGFTIDSIIGRDIDSQSEKCPKSPGHNGQDKDPSTKPSNSQGRTVSDCEHPINSDRLENMDSQISLQHDRLQSKPIQLHSDVNSVKHQRTSSSFSFQRDNLRDFNSSNAHIREVIQTCSTPETLRHFHEHLMQNAGVESGSLPIGSLEAHRHFRHPLATLNMEGYPPQMSLGPQLHPMLMNSSQGLRHMYPYIADRYPGCFIPRYGMSSTPGLFFQPYRKPKRIRTAFSPRQLLQLESSFEKSHYVVGQERKDLANELQLTETQVKVWFQNRRTKYKRTSSELEGEASGEGHMEKSPYSYSKSESDDSDIDDIDDVAEDYSNAHAYHHVIQTC